MILKRGFAPIGILLVLLLVLSAAFVTYEVVQTRLSTTPSAFEQNVNPVPDSSGNQTGRFPAKREVSHDAPVKNGSVSIVAPNSQSIGEEQVVKVNFNSAGISISAVALRLVSPLSQTVDGSKIAINPVLLASGDWTCPIRKSTVALGKTNVDIACVNVSTIGFSSPSVTLLASFPGTDSWTIDPSVSAITRKSDGKNILNTDGTNFNVN